MLQIINTQNIVEKLMSILGKNINIMDTNGIIVASGDSLRIGMVHEGALLVSKLNKQVDITSDYSVEFPNCKKGVNVPIVINDEVIGIVGISGEIGEVHKIGMTIKNLVELMIVDEIDHKQQLLSQTAKDDFIKDLIHENEYNDMHERSKLLKLDLSIKRMMILLQVKEFVNGNQVLFSSYIQDKVSQLLQQTCSKNDLYVRLYNNVYLLMLESSLEEIKEAFQKNFSSAEIQCAYFVSFDCTEIKDYRKAYGVAQELYHLLDAKAVDIAYYHEYAMEFLLATINKNRIQLFLELSKKNNIQVEISDEMYKIITAFIECDMNINEVSRRLFIHRNTLLYKIKKFQERYDYDVTQCKDCMTLYLVAVIERKYG